MVRTVHVASPAIQGAMTAAAIFAALSNHPPNVHTPRSLHANINLLPWHLSTFIPTSIQKIIDEGETFVGIVSSLIVIIH